MTAFRIIAALAIVALAVFIGRDLRRRVKSWIAAIRLLLPPVGITGVNLRGGQPPPPLNDALRRMAYIITAVFLLVLALSGFYPVLATGSHVSGFLLVIHVTIAPLFALSLCALAMFWAHRLRFDRSDLRAAQEIRTRHAREGAPRIRLMLKCGFWLVLVFSLPLMLTIILSLYPLFGTEGETLLIRLHGYSALLLLLAAACEVYLTLVYLKESPQ